MFLSKKDKELLKNAKKATEKLNRYSSGTKAAGSREANPKYSKLNGEADLAIRKLPAHLRSRVVIENFKG